MCEGIGKGLKKMSKTKGACSVEPVPRYIMSDQSTPNYELILEELHNHGRSQVGTSYFYIKKSDEWISLCRILYGGGKVFFHEVMDHQKHGISEEDIDQAILHGSALTTLPDHYFISPHIEMKLHTVIDHK
jgi:hypothetical protein